MITMKHIFNTILQWLKEKQYLIYFAIGMFILDFYLRYINRTMKSFSVLNIIPNAFTVFWIFIFALIIYICNKKLKFVITLLLGSIFSILMFTNIIFSRIFSKFFTFKDTIYASEGSKFMYSIFGYIDYMDIIVLIVFTIFIFLSIYTYKYIEKETKRKKGLTIVFVIIITIALMFFIQTNIGKSSDTTDWSAFSNKRNIYNQFNDTKRAMMLCGLYEYSMRDFYLSFIKKNNVDYGEYYHDINTYFASNNKTVSDYNGIFKDKNLILVMLEDIDTWMLNKKAMPTLYHLQNEGINFTEHYAANYASGFTFNTEFIANTGLIPNISALRTSYSYNQNNYDYSLANLFRQAGYTVNSIHKNKGSFYNRDNMHLAWGYEHHYDYANLETNGDNLDLDTTVVQHNLDKFIPNDKFMTFYITYSAHMPYEFGKAECQENLSYIKEQFDSDNEEYLCAMSQAKNTDDAIKLLLDELKRQQKLEDTVLIFFTDHYAYSMDNAMVANQKDESDNNLLTKTPFIIYNAGISKETVTKVNSTVDILPTIADLFGLKYNPNIYFGNSIFNSEYKGLVVFSDKSWFDGELYYKGEILTPNSDYINNTNQYVDNLLTLGGKIIESDYFRLYDINNRKK